MDTCMLDSLDTAKTLVSLAHETDEPIIVFDGNDECLIAMRPAVFERILFDSDLLNCQNRSSLRL